MYLFFINCIFITLATYITVKYLHFSNIEFAEAKTMKRSKTIITIVVLVVMAPSIWSAISMIKENNFDKSISEFVSNNRTLPSKAFIYDYRISHHKGSKVEIFISGEPLSSTDRSNLLEAAKKYGIKGDQISINERITAEGTSESEIIKGIYERSDSEISKRDTEISNLKKTIRELRQEEIPYIQIAKEVSNQYPAVKEISIAKGAEVKTGEFTRTDAIFVMIKTEGELTAQERLRLTNWLKIRLNFDKIILYEDKI